MRQTDMDGHINHSPLTLQREEHLKMYRREWVREGMDLIQLAQDSGLLWIR
jgi:hypothetical protein